MKALSRPILIVEDDTLTQLAIKQALQGSGFQVDTTSLAREALHKLKHYYYQAVIIDVQLPDMNGITMAQILRKRGERTPLIAHSGFDDYYTNETAYQAGIQAFFSKPVKLNHLIDWIKQNTDTQTTQRLSKSRNANRFRISSD